MDTPQDQTDFQAVREALRRYVATWNSRQVSQLKTHWDQSLADPIYVAEESEAMHGWPSIEKYWATLDGLDVNITVGTPQLSRLSPDFIASVYDMHWRIRFEAHVHWSQPIGGNLRVSVVLVRRGNEWKIVNYIEAPYAPAVQVKKWLERDAVR